MIPFTEELCKKILQGVENNNTDAPTNYDVILAYFPDEHKTRIMYLYYTYAMPPSSIVNDEELYYWYPDVKWNPEFYPYGFARSEKDVYIGKAELIKRKVVIMTMTSFCALMTTLTTHAAN